MSDDGWGDLLAMAAGAPSSSSVGVDEKREGYSRLDSAKTKTTKRRKRNDDAFRDMLDSRMNLSQRTTCSNGRNEWQIEAYKPLRSIRLGATALATDTESKELLKRESIANLARVCFPSCLGSGELSILEEKKNRLLDIVSEKRMSFENSVRLVMACDDLYLRLYYLQVSGALPDITNYLPHPTRHFGSLGDHAVIKNTLRTLCKKYPHVSDRYGLGEVDYHPLSAIHQQRLLESHCVFSGSCNAHETLRELNKVRGYLPTQLEYHNTPAPLLLQEWRDSCRDVLCHLFCYATLASSTLLSLIEKLRELKVKSVMELGAGTGYLAKLLHPMQVHAFDVDPPSHSFNDYHGRTRPFVEVRKGTHETVLDNIHAAALLLCYPPPQSKMANDALQAFMRKGGKTFVHIGEWKGLTGSAEFEALLQQDWTCIYRMPCLTWGTDAADVTIWTRCTSTKPSILLPCIKCGEFEAMRRCRLIRHAVYCNRNCFELDRDDAFRVMCLLSLVPPDLSLDFHDDLHFQQLP